MQTKSRKFLSVLLALLMMGGVIAVAPITASAETHGVGTAADFYFALDFASSGDTIKLLNDITYTDMIEI